MTGYDFDKTIFDGDSFTHLWLYCLRYVYIIVLLPYQLIVLLLFGIKLISRKTIKELFAVYLWLIPRKQKVIGRFWDKKLGRIKPWYLAQKREDDLIISASPYFLVRPACERLGLKNVIATDMSLSTGRIKGPNCYGLFKAELFERAYGSELTLEAFYSDSMSDLPMMQKSYEGFLVTGSEIKKVFP